MGPRSSLLLPDDPGPGGSDCHYTARHPCCARLPTYRVLSTFMLLLVFWFPVDPGAHAQDHQHHGHGLGLHPNVAAGEPDPYATASSVRALSGASGITERHGRIAPATTASPPVRAERNGEWGHLFAGKWFFEDWRRIDVTSSPLMSAARVLCIGADEHRSLPLAEQRLMSMVLFQAILIMAWLDPAAVRCATRWSCTARGPSAPRPWPRSQRPGRRLHIWAAPHDAADLGSARPGVVSAPRRSAPQRVGLAGYQCVKHRALSRPGGPLGACCAGGRPSR